MKEETILICEPSTSEEYNPLNFAVVSLKKEVINKIERGLGSVKSGRLDSCKITLGSNIIGGYIEDFSGDEHYLKLNLDPNKNFGLEEMEIYDMEGGAINIFSAGDICISFSIRNSPQIFETPLLSIEFIDKLFKKKELVFEYDRESENAVSLGSIETVWTHNFEREGEFELIFSKTDGHGKNAVKTKTSEKKSCKLKEFLEYAFREKNRTQYCGDLNYDIADEEIKDAFNEYFYGRGGVENYIRCGGRMD